MITSMRQLTQLRIWNGIAPTAVLFVLVVSATPAHAQGPYVMGGVGIDVSRLDHVEGAGLPDMTADGEAIAFSLRLGTAIGDRWGVELAFTRPDEITQEGRLGFPISLATVAG